MAKRTSRSGGVKIPVAVVLGFAPLARSAITQVQTNGWARGMEAVVSNIIPYNVLTKKIDFSGLYNGLYPILAGMAVHKIVGGTLGVNRAMGRAGIPWLRL